MNKIVYDDELNCGPAKPQKFESEWKNIDYGTPIYNAIVPKAPVPVTFTNCLLVISFDELPEWPLQQLQPDP